MPEALFTESHVVGDEEDEHKVLVLLVKVLLLLLVDLSDFAPLKLFNVQRQLCWHIDVALHQANVPLSSDTDQLPMGSVSYRPFNRWRFHAILLTPGIEAHILLLLLDLSRDLPVGLKQRPSIRRSRVADSQLPHRLLCKPGKQCPLLLRPDLTSAHLFTHNSKG